MSERDQIWVCRDDFFGDHVWYPEQTSDLEVPYVPAADLEASKAALKREEELLAQAYDNLESTEAELEAVKAELVDALDGKASAITRLHDERDKARHFKAENAELREIVKRMTPQFKIFVDEGGHDPSVGIDASYDWITIEMAEKALAANGEG